MEKFRVIILGLALSLTACSQNPFTKSDVDPTKKPDEQTSPPANEGSGTGETQPIGVNFQIIRSQLLQTNCLKCHSASGGNKAGINLETYDNVLRNLKDVEASVVEGFMPPRGPVSQELKDLLVKWIQLGAPQ